MAPEDPPRLPKDPSKTLHRPSKRRPKTPQDLPKTPPRPAQDPPRSPQDRPLSRCVQHPLHTRLALKDKETPRSHLGGSWAALGRLLEAKLEDLGAILDGLGGQFDGLEANLGASWSQLGRFWCQLGGLGGNFTRFCGFCKNLKKPLVFIGFLSIGGSSWRLLDAKLASSWPS